MPRGMYPECIKFENTSLPINAGPCTMKVGEIWRYYINTCFSLINFLLHLNILMSILYFLTSCVECPAFHLATQRSHIYQVGVECIGYLNAL
jgi:hypothetical protein